MNISAFRYCNAMCNIMICLVVICTNNLSAKEMVIKTTKPHSQDDTRSNYPIELLVAAFERTKEQYGSYQIERIVEASPLREEILFQKGELINLTWKPVMQAQGYRKFSLPILIPMQKGMLGYRIFLIHKNDQEKFRSTLTLDDLKKLTVGQRTGWGDIAIFEHNGIEVVKGNSYEGLFRMTNAQGRFDYFSRGINEAPAEYETRKNKLKNLRQEESILLIYPYPVFFYVHKNHLRRKNYLYLSLQDYLKHVLLTPNSICIYYQLLSSYLVLLM